MSIERIQMLEANVEVLKNRLIKLERTGLSGSESSGLLCRREAADNETRDGERSRDSCAHCADKVALVKRLEAAALDWRDCINEERKKSRDERLEKWEQNYHYGRADGIQGALQELRVRLESIRRASEASVRRNREIPHPSNDQPE